MISSEDSNSLSGVARDPELPLPEPLQAFTRDQVKSLIDYFGEKHGHTFSACELGEKYRILERYLHSLAIDNEQYEKFLDDFRVWRRKKPAVSLLEQSNPIESEPSVESVLNLPQVNETWSIGGYHGSQKHSGKDMMRLFDGDQRSRSFRLMRDIKNLETLSCDVLQLLYSSMFDPVLGKAARPKRLMLKSPDLVDKLKEKLVTYHIEVVHNLQGNQASSVAVSERYSCYGCGLTCEKNKLKKCSGCHAVFYCSTDCFKRDWKKKPVEASHKTWCPQFKDFVNLGSDFANLFPFPFADSSTADDFVFTDYLKRKNLLGLGYWELLAKACENCEKESCDNENHQDCSLKASTVNDEDIESPFIDQSLTFLDKIVASQESTQFRSWREFYNSRNLSLDNPVAALLSTCLTIRYISRVLYPAMVQDKTQNLHIAVMEAEYNPKYAGILKQLLYKEANLHLKLSIYQSKFPSFKIEFKPENDVGDCSLVVDIKQGAFPTESIRSSERPDVVIGFNCFDMVARPDNAMKIVKALVDASVPLFFVNFCPMFSSMQQSWLQQVIQQEGIQDDVRITRTVLNPFASPFRLRNASFVFPWFQNGLMFYVMKD